MITSFLTTGRDFETGTPCPGIAKHTWYFYEVNGIPGGRLILVKARPSCFQECPGQRIMIISFFSFTYTGGGLKMNLNSIVSPPSPLVFSCFLYCLKYSRGYIFSFGDLTPWEPVGL